MPLSVWKRREFAAPDGTICIFTFFSGKRNVAALANFLVALCAGVIIMRGKKNFSFSPFFRQMTRVGNVQKCANSKRKTAVYCPPLPLLFLQKSNVLRPADSHNFPSCLHKKRSVIYEDNPKKRIVIKVFLFAKTTYMQYFPPCNLAPDKSKPNFLCKKVTDM